MLKRVIIQGVVWPMVWCFAAACSAAEWRVESPDASIVVAVSDAEGLRYGVTVDGKPLINSSILGLDFKGDVSFGPASKIREQKESAVDETWENRFGAFRKVRNHFNETYFTIDEAGRTFGLIVRVYDDGIAFRYDLPEESRLGDFVLTNERTSIEFAEDAKCWAGEPSDCAEVRYPEFASLSSVPSKAGYKSVVPLLVEASAAFVAVSEADVLDWSAMSIIPTGTKTVRIQPDRREDGNGLVVSSAPRRSPWRAMIIARKPAELLTSQLISNLATPSRLSDTDWIKPGVAAWDPWWTGTNPNHPQTREFTGVEARGDTKTDLDFIDFAAEMGWQYQLIDWRWYANMTSWNKSLHAKPNPNQADFTRHASDMDLPQLIEHAREKNVRLIVWAHSLDLKTFGEEKALAYIASLGAAGVKIDFLNSKSQQTVEWCQHVLELAAKYKLLVNFHGTYHPSGLSRTYPNFISQEGVLGNEFNKLPGKKNDPAHQVTLPFTRALLGPMDYTPGAFLNRDVDQFKVTFPAQGMGSRARQLALTVLYPSPLLVLCDTPAHYRGQQGVEFLRSIPTVWDETVVLSAEVGRNVGLARRSGDRWYIAAINLDQNQVELPLSFLPEGDFQVTSFADDPQGKDLQAVVTGVAKVTKNEVLKPQFGKDGGFVAVVERSK